MVRRSTRTCRRGRFMEGVMTFSIDYETFRCVEEGSLVRIVYSAHLHYVYELEQV